MSQAAEAAQADEEIVDAEVVHPETSTALAVQQHPEGHATGMLVPLATPDEVREAMTVYQQTVAAVLDPADWQDAGRGERFVKKSGWRKIAKAYGISVTILHHEKIRDGEGNLIRAETIVRAAGPNGQVFDGDGYCSVDEDRFKQASGRKKIENDLPATATTRAMNRAISSLVGFGEVSGEEVSAGGAPVWAEKATAEQDKAARAALGQLLDGDGEQAAAVYKDLLGLFGLGLLPVGVAAAFDIVAQRRADGGDA